MYHPEIIGTLSFVSRPGYQITSSNKSSWEKPFLCLGVTENRTNQPNKTPSILSETLPSKHNGKEKANTKANKMNEVVPLLAALTLGGRGPLQTLAGTLAPPGVR